MRIRKFICFRDRRINGCMWILKKYVKFSRVFKWVRIIPQWLMRQMATHSNALSRSWFFLTWKFILVEKIHFLIELTQWQHAYNEITEVIILGLSWNKWSSYGWAVCKKYFLENLKKKDFNQWKKDFVFGDLNAEVKEE